MKKITPSKIWELYRKYDYMGEPFEYKFLIFRDAVPNTPREMFIDNKETGKGIESISMGVISKERFLDLVRKIIKKKPADINEWLSS